MKRIQIVMIMCLIVMIAMITIFLSPTWLQRREFIEIVDQAGRRVKIPVRVERVVSLWPEATRVVIALGVGDKLVGVSLWDTKDPIMTKLYPRLKDIPAVGTTIQPNVEEIMKLKPDVILADALRANVADDLQEKTGIPVFCVRINPPALRGKFSLELFELIGKVLGREERGKYLRSFLEGKLEDIKSVISRIPSEKRLKAYVAFAFDPLITYGLKDPLESAGLINVAYNPKMVWYRVSMEQVIAWNPDIVILHFLHRRLGNYTVSDIMKDPSWQQVKAIKEGRVYVVIVGYAGWYPEMIVINTMQLAKIAYPDKFPNLDIIKEGDEIFYTLYGVRGFFRMLVEKWGLST